MKFRYLPLVLFLTVCYWASAQNQHRIDSLRALARETKIDTVRIEAYTRLMAEIMASDTLETTRLRDLAILRSQAIQYHIGMADAYFHYGFLKMQLAQMDSARWYFDQSHASSLLINDVSFASRALTQIGASYYYEGKYEQAIAFYQASNEAAKNDKHSDNVLSGNFLNLGSIFYDQSNYDSALYYYELAAAMANSLGERERLNYAIALQNLGNVHRLLSNTPKSLDYYLQSLRVSEEIGDSVGVAYLTSSIGFVYNHLEETDLALEYFMKSKRMREQLGMIRSVAYTYSNIGKAHGTKGDYQNAEKFLKMAMETSKSTANENLLGAVHAGLAELYFDQELYDLTQPHLDSALKIQKALNLPLELAESYNLIGKLAIQKEQYQQAIQYLDEGLRIGEELGVPHLIRNVSLDQSVLYAQLGEFSKAYEAHVRFKAMDDSIRNEDNTRKIALLESEYTFEKEKEQIAEENERKSQAQQQQIQQQRYYTYASTGGLVSLLLIAFFIYRNYRQKQRANLLLSEKNDQIHHQALELEHKNQDLQELSSFKQGMTDMIAHDMKNPLNVVIGLSEGAPDQAKMKQVNQSGKLMLQMVTNMLDVQKFDQASMQLNQAPHTLKDILVQSKYQVELLAIARSIQFDFQVSSDIHLTCDREVILRVLVNLFTNGIKYSKPGGKITVKAAATDERIQISVSDTGKGIHPEDLPHVFDKFWQSEAKKSGQIQSTGLGLTFCKIAVEAHGGSIQVKSSPGKGSTFTFDLAIGNAPMVTKEKTTTLSKSEVDAIQEVIQEVRRIPLYQFADIEAALTKIELQSDSVEEWKEALRHAALNWDEDGFEQLLSQKEMSN